MKKMIQMFTGKWAVFIVTALACTAGAFIFLESKPAKGGLHNDTAPQLSGMPVTVQTVFYSAYPARITALGEVNPLWQSTIKARVDGPIVYLNPKLQSGTRVKKGEVLVKIEETAYQAQVSEDKKRVALAEVDLLKEEREAKEAQKNWERSGLKGSPASDLVLRKPQLNSARTGLNAAQKALALSKIRLSYTKICAPFDGVIVERHVSPGESLITGDKVLTLYGMDTVEVAIHVSAEQLALLGLNLSKGNREKAPLLSGPDKSVAARLVSTQQNAFWQAQVVRDGQRLDSGSRLQTLYLQVAQPMAQTPPLLPGTFVRAEITGRKVADLLCLPETALTKQGVVWFVDGANRLEPVQAKPIFYGNGVVYIHTGEKNSQKSLRIAVLPNASFAAGLLVQPRQKERG
ncbi:efflux RND transporter periplasmic adaptor subunit [Desulfobacter postgatei]|jgi:RND family efflux transporter MFP subunit|uniref:efflux RND transporter periplasmic adaptor subunit n=1 Tax=Desulfobacter postgatei TaxID=2293 RepID=UPI002A361D48|nr:efflux RND transporter periplasmic adaptor subunit [Desulfobacter postgatei]MDX9965048.1 efflux RND transporter periplasmic adaptor subunit [Desulfobacter postgatei]